MKELILNEFNDKCKVNDNEKLPYDLIEAYGYIGFHDVCCGLLRIRKSSDKWNIILCERCGLRVRIPIEAKTFGELREYFENLRH